MAKQFLKLTITSENEQAEDIRNILSDYDLAGWEEIENNTEIIFSMFFDTNSNPEKIDASSSSEKIDTIETIKQIQEDIKAISPQATFAQEYIAEENWADAWMDNFTPIACGDYFEVLPPWEKQQNKDLFPLIIVPKMAFGTGHHATTALCIKAITQIHKEALIKENDTFLDLGTGSGILAIALAHLKLQGLAIDIDPQAIICTHENILTNNMQERIHAETAGIESIDKKFKIIVANILSEPLIELAPLICERLEEKSVLILSGILTEQAQQVIDAYALQKLTNVVHNTEEEWSALIFYKNIEK